MSGVVHEGKGATTAAAAGGRETWAAAAGISLRIHTPEHV